MNSEFIYGRNAVNEALQAGKHRIKRLYLLESLTTERRGRPQPAKDAGTGKNAGGHATVRQPQRPAARAYTDPRAPANARFQATPSSPIEDMAADGGEEAEEGHGTVAAILQQARAKGIIVEAVARFELDQMTNRANHQGVVAESEAFVYTPFADLLAMAQQDSVGDTPGRDSAPFFLVLDYLQDPQNLGTLIRTAEAVGVTGVIIPERRAAGVTPAVRNASSGAVEHIAVAMVTNLPQTLESLKGAGIWVGGLDRGPDAIPYDKANFTGKLALVVGSEGSGIGRLVRTKCDFIIQLPMLGKIESLNAATAGSICLYETLRQRSTKKANSTK